MSLTILSVAYPLAPVSSDAVGGAEQVLATLDRAIVAAGGRSLVIAQEGSRVAGELIATRALSGEIDEQVRAEAQDRHGAAIRETLARSPVDLVHLHGIDFASYLPPPGPPTLVTLHLPLAWYPDAALRPDRPGTWLHGVSAAQQHGRDDGHLLPPIPNGVDLDAFAGRRTRRRFALMLGRICPEKGVHLAIEAAARAGMPLLIAGQVFPYPAHLGYFAAEIEPRLGRGCRFLGPVGFARKRRLLQAAACLLVPSLAPETSSLVAREALACGTPVVAFPNGALADAVADGRTGFLVADVEAMAAAIGRVGGIDPAACRAEARARFSAATMVRSYLDLYRFLVGRAA